MHTKAVTKTAEGIVFRETVLGANRQHELQMPITSELEG